MLLFHSQLRYYALGLSKLCLFLKEEI